MSKHEPLEPDNQYCKHCGIPMFVKELTQKPCNGGTVMKKDMGNDSLGMGNPDKEVCKHCQEVIISFNAGADDFDYADVAEAIDQHVCHQRKHDDAEIDKASDAYEAKVTADADVVKDACGCCDGTGICPDIGGKESSCMTCCGSGKDLPFKHESCEPVTVEVTWMEGHEERRDETSITNIVSFVDQLIGLGMTSSFIQDLPHDDFFSMITDKDIICAIEDQHGEPYCHTHKCSPSDPCIVQGCPHCIGEQQVAYESAERAHEIGG